MELIDAGSNPTGNDALLEHLQTQLKQHGKNFLCGFSGGLDSTVLLHLAAKVRGIKLRAIHVNHGLHADAGIWLQHCQSICDQLRVDLVVVNVHVALDSGEGLEASARRARYRAIAECIGADEILLTAHHLQDQSETFLLRLLRGSGSHGLAAMRASSTAHGFSQLRPLLSVSKVDLQHYADIEKLGWVEDPSNTKTDFDRNYLRQEIMPLLEKRWPQAAGSFSRSAGLLAEENECLREQSAIFLSQIQGVDPHSISVPHLLQHSRSWRAQILRSWTQSLGRSPMPANILQEIEESVLNAKRDSTAKAQWADTQISAWRDCLYCLPLQKRMPEDWQYRWQDGTAFTLPNGDRWGFQTGPGNLATIAGALRNDFNGDLLITLRKGGEKILLENREHHSVVKTCLQELGIPPWERGNLPLVFSQAGECLAVGDVLLSGRFKAFCEQYSARFSRTV